MFNTILKLIKIIVIAGVAVGSVALVGWLTSLLDWSLFLWVVDVLKNIQLSLGDWFNFPNVIIIMSYFLVKELLLLGLDIVFSLTRRGKNG